MCKIVFGDEKINIKGNTVEQLKNSIEKQFGYPKKNVSFFFRNNGLLNLDAIDTHDKIKDTDTILMVVSDISNNKLSEFSDLLKLVNQSEIFSGINKGNLYYECLKKIKPFIGNGKMSSLSSHDQYIVMNVNFVLEKYRPDTSDHSSYSLILSRNGISKIPPTISYFNHITYLKLDNNCLDFIPNEFVSLSNLVDLDLSNNKLSFLTSVFHNLKMLEKVNLSDNLFSEFPRQITDAINIKTLLLNNNQIDSIDDNISRLLNLENLSINNNCLYHIHDNISNLSNLKTLSLAGNMLTSIPENFISLVYLRHINLSKNKIRIIPDYIQKMISLTDLDLSDNTIDSFTDSNKKLNIFDLKKQIDIKLDGNPIWSQGNPIFTDHEQDQDFCIVNHETSIPMKPGFNKFI